MPTPGKYNQMNGLLRQGNYKMPDKEVVWDTGMIRTIFGRFEYTGALVMGRRHTVAVGSKVTRKTAERDVVIRKNINPAIITEEEYEVASASIMFMTKPEYRGAKDFLLKGKVRCGNCHRSLAYTDGGIHPKIYCPHKVQAGRYSHCPEDAYPVSVIEGHIWYSLKRILRILDSVQRESEEKYKEMLHKMAVVLDVDPRNISIPTGYREEDMIYKLLVLEDYFPEMKLERNGRTGEVVINLQNKKINEFLYQWGTIRGKKKQGMISEDEYMQWKYCRNHA